MVSNITNEEVLAFYEKLSNYYGDKLADFEQHPNIFAYQVKLYKHCEESATQ
jgi:hypothetical protein